MKSVSSGYNFNSSVSWVDALVVFFKGIMGEIAILLGSLLGFLTLGFKAYKWWMIRSDQIKMQVEAEVNIMALVNRQLIKKVLVNLGKEMGAQKIVSLKMHNGGGFLDPQNPYEYASIMYEKLFPEF